MLLCKGKDSRAFTVQVGFGNQQFSRIIIDFCTFFLVCGGKLAITNTAEHFLYSHAKYGDTDYDKLEDCDWYFEVPANKRIKIKFLTFELEYEQNCSYDYVQVFDGSYDDLVLLLGKLCGTTVSFIEIKLNSFPHFKSSIYFC